MKLTLFRHAEVDEKYASCYNGHIDISLSQKGIMDTKEVALKYNSSSYDAIFCSDLKRCVQSIEPFGFENVIFTKELREKSFGMHEGMSYDEICSTCNIKYENFTQWMNALDGESIEEFTLHVKRFFFEYLPSLHVEDIFIMTSAGVIKTLLHLLNNITLEEAFGIKIEYMSKNVIAM
ncbi:MAG: histidine phosphatase family protein [Campylobacterota bacterium]|nr:histidine phosphatase family protein [Campylobacterota bacterium]